MGIVKNGLSVLTLSLVMSGAAVANTFTPADDTWESEMCVTAATSSKLNFHGKVSDLRPSVHPQQNYKLIANNLYCNNVNVVQWAINTGNDDIAERLGQYRTRHGQIQDISMMRSGTVHVGSK